MIPWPPPTLPFTSSLPHRCGSDVMPGIVTIKHINQTEMLFIRGGGGEDSIFREPCLCPLKVPTVLHITQGMCGVLVGSSRTQQQLLAGPNHSRSGLQATASLAATGIHSSLEVWRYINRVFHLKYKHFTHIWWTWVKEGQSHPKVFVSCQLLLSS